MCLSLAQGRVVYVHVHVHVHVCVSCCPLAVPGWRVCCASRTPPSAAGSPAPEAAPAATVPCRSLCSARLGHRDDHIIVIVHAHRRRVLLPLPLPSSSRAAPLRDQGPQIDSACASTVIFHPGRCPRRRKDLVDLLVCSPRSLERKANKKSWQN